MANAQIPTTLCGETMFSGDAIKRHSVMFLDSDSEGNEKSATKTVNTETSGLLGILWCFPKQVHKS